MTDTGWANDALCFGMEEADYFFFEDSANDYATARNICADCPVAQQCLDAALKEEVTSWRYGVRGGLSARERSAIAKSTPKEKPKESDKMAIARAMWAAGNSQTHIGSLIGVSARTVGRWLRRQEQEAA